MTKDQQAVVHEALQVWAVDFVNDTEINATDFLAWFTDWRGRAMEAFPEIAQEVSEGGSL